MTDKIEVIILDDGTLRITVEGSVSSVNHGSADAMLLMAEKLMAGTVKRSKVSHAHSHVHEHAHEPVKARS